MTEAEFTAAQASGSITAQDAASSDSGAVPALPASPSISLEQFLPILTQLQSVQLAVSAAPTYIPQTFQEQIAFVFDGTNYYLYLYFNNQWNSFSVSGGGGGVTQLLAGTNISISPSGGTGTVTITATGIQSIVAGTGISVSTSGGVVTITNSGVTSIIAGTGISVSGATGPVTVSASGSGGFSVKTGASTVNMSSGSTQTIAHGLGKIPSIVRMSGGFHGGSGLFGGTYGTYDGTNSFAAYWGAYVSAGVAGYVDSAAILHFETSGNEGVNASITMDATNLYLTFSTLPGGGLSQVAAFMWEVSG